MSNTTTHTTPATYVAEFDSRLVEYEATPAIAILMAVEFVGEQVLPLDLFTATQVAVADWSRRKGMKF